MNKAFLRLLFTAVFIGSICLIGCSGNVAQQEEGNVSGASQESPETDHDEAEHEDQHEDEHEDGAAGEILPLPELSAVELNDERLKVVATTSIIGDVVSQVGGETIELTTLIGPGQDSHSYEPSTQDIRTATDADVIFLNGWDLEESLAHDLEEMGQEGVAVVAISAGIEPLVLGEAEHEEHEEEHEVEHEEDDEHTEAEDDHQHSGADPHVWFSIPNVEQWVENVTAVLSALDPANAEIYEANAAEYSAELAELAAYVESQIAQLPEENRLLVTNHDSFRYFATDYHFEVVGTVIPASSTLAEPSARDIAELVEVMEAHGLCTIFTETSVGDSLAQTVAAELDGCETVMVLSLYTESVGQAGSGADSYIGMFRANVDVIVEGLK